MAWNTLSSYSNQAVDANLFSGIGLDLRTHGDDVDAAGYGVANAGWMGFLAGDLIGTAYSVTTAAWSGGIATYTIGTHHIVVNQTITITGITPSGFNQAQARVTGVTSTTVSAQLASNPGAWSSGGTVTVVQHLSGASAPPKGTLAVDSNGVFNGYSGSAWLKYITNPLTTKGDLLVTDGTALARLAGSGTNGFVLTYDSAQTYGIKWATPLNIPTSINCRAWKQSSGALTINTSPVQLTFDTNNYDTASIHSTVTNTSRFTVPTSQGGVYLCQGGVSVATGAGAGAIFRLSIRVNGTTTYGVQYFMISANTDFLLQVSDLLSLSATDYVEFMAQFVAGGPANTANAEATFGSIIRLY